MTVWCVARPLPALAFSVTVRPFTLNSTSSMSSLYNTPGATLPFFRPV
jgi:hypothetical protein